MRDLEASDTPSAAAKSQALFAERFSVGVFVGAGTVSVVHLHVWWAASLAFTAFVVFLLFRWSRLARDPLVDDSLPTKY